MKIIYTLILAIAITSNTSASKDSTAIKYANTITAQELREHLLVISSDEFNGREAGTEGQKKAAEYIKEYFQGLGIPPLDETKTSAPIKDGYFQEFLLQVTNASNSELTINDSKSQFGEDFFFLDAPSESITNIKEISFVGFGLSNSGFNEMPTDLVKDKYVMLIDGLPENKKGEVVESDERFVGSFFDRVKARKEDLSEKGVSGALVVLHDIEKKAKAFSFFLKGGRTTLYSEDKKNIPIIFISEEIADQILEENSTTLAKLEKKIIKKGVPIVFETSTNIQLDLGSGIKTPTSENILGFVEGTDLKDEIVVITAHFDHVGASKGDIYNGADDDGSGTVTLLELAEAFTQAKKDGYGPRRSMLFMPVSAEEKGLLGSRYYTDNPVFPLENTVVDLNIDMIGRHDTAHNDQLDYVYIIGSNRLSTELHNISENANSTYTNLHLDYTYNEPDDPNKFYYRSDHYNFAKNNIPVIFYFSGVHEDYHKPTDTIEKIEFDNLEKRARLIFYTAWELANRDERIQVDVVE